VIIGKLIPAGTGFVYGRFTPATEGAVIVDGEVEEEADVEAATEE